MIFRPWFWKWLYRCLPPTGYLRPECAKIYGHTWRHFGAISWPSDTVAWYRCTTPVLFCGHRRSPPLLESFFLNMGREWRWPRWIKKALHIGIKRLCPARPCDAIWHVVLWGSSWYQMELHYLSGNTQMSLIFARLAFRDKMTSERMYVISIGYYCCRLRLWKGTWYRKIKTLSLSAL